MVALETKQPKFYHCIKCGAGVAEDYIDRFIPAGADRPICSCGGIFEAHGDGALDRMDHFLATLKPN